MLILGPQDLITITGRQSIYAVFELDEQRTGSLHVCGNRQYLEGLPAHKLLKLELPALQRIHAADVVVLEPGQAYTPKREGRDSVFFVLRGQAGFSYAHYGDALEWPARVWCRGDMAYMLTGLTWTTGESPHAGKTAVLEIHFNPQTPATG
jgi:hypothetical protein